MTRKTFVIHLTADTSPVDPGDPVLQQEIGDTIAAAICSQIAASQIAAGRWPNTGSITADVVDVIAFPLRATVPVEPLDPPGHERYELEVPDVAAAQQRLTAAIGDVWHDWSDEMVGAAVLAVEAVTGHLRQHENTTKKGAGDDGPDSEGDAAPSGDGAHSHDVGRTEPEPAPEPPEGWTPEPGDLVELTRRNGEAPAGTRAHVKATGTDMAICTMTIRVDHAVHFEDLKAVPR